MNWAGKNTRFSLLITAAFAVLAGSLLNHHELWRDELQAWLLARDTPTLGAFFHAMRYEGTPPLWHLLLRPFALTSAAPWAMQALHGLIGAAWVFILCHYSPFNRSLKILLAFSYYVLYQYTVVSRNYSLGLLLLSLACVFFKYRAIYPARIGITLGLASLTSAPAWVLAASWAVVCRKTTKVWRYYCPGAILGIILMLPASDTIFPSAAGWVTHLEADRVHRLLEAVVKAFFPAPFGGSGIWENPGIFHLPLFSGLSVLLAGILLIGGAWVCSEYRESEEIYLLGTLGLLAFYYCKYIGYSRHQGFLFFNFIFALWIAGGIRKPWVSWILAGMLGLQTWGTAVAAYEDLRRPFSCGKETAQYIQGLGPDSLLIAAGPDYAGVPVAGYLRQPFYAAQGNRLQTYTRWDRRRIEMFDDREFIRRARHAAAQLHKRPLMLINYPMDPAIERSTHAKFLRSFTGSLIGDEDYYLYTL